MAKISTSSLTPPPPPPPPVISLSLFLYLPSISFFPILLGSVIYVPEFFNSLFVYFVLGLKFINWGYFLCCVALYGQLC